MTLLRSERTILVLLTLLFITLVTFGGLRHRLWGDEAETALFGKMVSQTGLPLEWDGTNFLGHEADSANIGGKIVNHTNPWLMYYAAALSFKLFGVSDFTSRLPFIFVSIFIIPGAYLLVKKLTNARIALITIITLSLSTQLILFSYQARYYSLLILLAILFVYFSYNLFDQKSKTILWLWLISLISIFNHYIIFPVFYISVLMSFIFYSLILKKPLVRIFNSSLKYILAGILSLVIFLPYFLVLHPLSTASSQFTPPDSLWILVFGWLEVLRDAYGFYNTSNNLPVTLILGLPFIFFFKKSRRMLAPLVLFILIPFFYLLFTSLHTILFITYNPLASMRYGSLIIPFMVMVSILLLEPLYHLSRKIYYSIVIVYIFTNLFTLNPLHIFILDYVRELSSPYQTSETAVSEYLLRNAEAHDTVFLSLQRAHEPLVYTTGDKFRFVNVISPLNTDLLGKNYGNFPKYIYNFIGKPDWIILFGNYKAAEIGANIYDFRDYHQLAPLDLEKDYEKNILPVYYTDTTRPELYQHRFTPLIPDDNQKIYIYKKK